MVVVRLDTVTQVKARVEKQALLTYSDALRRAEQAKEDLHRALAAARVDVRGPGDASDFWLDDAAHQRALVRVRQAEQRLAEAVTRCLTLPLVGRVDRRRWSGWGWRESSVTLDPHP